MRRKKILICGATGFIGRNIAEQFLQNKEFDVCGTYFKTTRQKFHPKIKMLRADLTKPSDVKRVVKGRDIIIQAAAVTSGAMDIVTRPYQHVTENAIMNSLIFRSAHEHEISHVVYFSCAIMYQSCNTLIRESDFDANKEMLPSYFGAGWTKVYLEKMCEFYSRLKATKYTVIRHSNIYGPFDKFDLLKSHVFGATITKVMTAVNNGQIVIWGKGAEIRDLLYVSDLVDSVVKIINNQKSPFELYNIGYGSSISVNNLVRKIISLSGKSISLRYDSSKPTIKSGICLDTSKAKKDLGWFPRVSLDEGIKKTIEWYKSTYIPFYHKRNLS